MQATQIATSRPAVPQSVVDEVHAVIEQHPEITFGEVGSRVHTRQRYIRDAVKLLRDRGLIQTSRDHRNAVRLRAVVPQEQQCHVYRYYDADDVLLYVGMTSSPEKRNRSHAEKSVWFRFAARGEVTPCPTRAHAEEDERDQILNLQPLFNLVYGRPDRDRVLVEYLVTHGALDLLRPAAIGEVRR